MSFPRYPAYKDSGVEWLGEVPEHWEVLPLKREFAVVGGSTPKSDMQSYWDGDIQWITPADLSRLQSFEITESIRTITAEGLNSCGATMVPIGSVVVSTRAPIGSLGIAAIDLCTNQGRKALVPIDQMSSKFTAYFLGIATEALNVRGRGATFLEVSGDELGAFKATLPPCQEQVQIATFLDRETAKIDALIAEQQRLIELLQEKRQAVISHAVTKGLNPDAPMKDSGVEWLGEVPEHWEVRPIKHLCDIYSGFPFKSDLFQGDGIPVVRMSNISGGCIDLKDAACVPEHEVPAEAFIRAGDLLLGLSGSVGNFGIAKEEDLPAAVNQRVALIRTSNPILKHFLGSSLFSDQVTCGLPSTTIANVSASQLGNCLLAVPPSDEQEQIEAFLLDFVSGSTELMTSIEASLSLLQERRSALISAAVNGQIDVRSLVPEAEAA